jgi:hypothetical protein
MTQQTKTPQQRYRKQITVFDLPIYEKRGWNKIEE